MILSEFEHHGLSTYLFDLVESINNKLKDFDKQQFKIKLRGIIVTIDIEIGKKSKGGRDAFTELAGENHFYIYLNTLQPNLILHELKHIDRIIARNYKTDIYYFLTNIGTDVTEKYSSFFIKKNVRERFSDCLYFFTPDEFESQYNDIFYRLKDLIVDDMNEDERRKTIRNFLMQQEIYNYYKFYYDKGGFKFRDFFKSKRGLNLYIHIFNTKIKQFEAGKNYRQWKNITYENVKMDKLIQQLEYKINKILFKGYKKFHRLYTLFLTNDLEI